MQVSAEKAHLIVALRARLERSDRDLAKAAVAWLEVHGRGDVEEQRARVRALGELWRRERLATLHCEVIYKGPDEDFRDPAVLLLALDECDPEAVPSFREWLSERNLKQGG